MYSQYNKVLQGYSDFDNELVQAQKWQYPNEIGTFAPDNKRPIDKNYVDVHSNVKHFNPGYVLGEDLNPYLHHLLDKKPFSDVTNTRVQFLRQFEEFYDSKMFEIHQKKERERRLKEEEEIRKKEKERREIMESQRTAPLG